MIVEITISMKIRNRKYLTPIPPTMVFDDGVRDKFFSVFVVLHLEVRVLLVFKIIPASCLQIS